MRSLILAVSACAALPVMAQEHRELAAHEHGVGSLGMAIEGQAMVMELRAPGADIVGFEHGAESAEDRSIVESAIAKLAAPLELFVLPEAAGCAVTEAHVGLVGEDDELHGEHEHHEEHEHDDEYTHDDVGEHHDEAGGHTEFHAEYALNCADPKSLDQIRFAYFDAFPNARRLSVQLVSGIEARAFEVNRDAPELSLDGLN